MLTTTKIQQLVSYLLITAVLLSTQVQSDHIPTRYVVRFLVVHSSYLLTYGSPGGVVIRTSDL